MQSNIMSYKAKIIGLNTVKTVMYKRQ